MIGRGVWIGLLVAWSATAGAEVLDLEQAIERALANDPRIEERRHLARAAEALVQEAQGADDLLFSVNAFVGLTTDKDGGLFEEGNTCTGTCTVRSDAFDDLDELTLWGNLRFAIIKPLYTFGKVERYTEAAEGNRAVKAEEIRKQRIETRMQVTRAYNGYLAARDGRRLLESVRERGEKALALVERWLADGRAGTRQADLYALRTGIAVIDKFLAQAQGLERIALDGLKVLTGIGLDGELEVADARLSPAPLPVETLQELRGRALEDRPEVTQLRAGLAARRALVAARKAEAKPNIYTGVVGTVSVSGRDRIDNPFIYDPFNSAGATPVLGMQWEWSSGRQPARVAQAEAELDALIELSSFARQGIPFEVAEKYHRVQALYTSVGALERGSRDGRRWMIASYADFEAGVEEPAKVMDAFRNYLLTHSDYLQTVNEYNMGVAELRKVAGEYR